MKIHSFVAAAILSVFASGVFAKCPEAPKAPSRRANESYRHYSQRFDVYERQFEKYQDEFRRRQANGTCADLEPDSSDTQDTGDGPFGDS